MVSPLNYHSLDTISDTLGGNMYHHNVANICDQLNKILAGPLSDNI